MSDFKRKIEIVESTTPPPNRYNWWFDLNTERLKRYKNGKWELYDYMWPTTSLPPANEIWLELDYCYDPDGLANAVTDEFQNIGTIQNVDVTVREDETALVRIIFDQQLTNITVAESIYLSSITEGSILIKFPNLVNLNYTGSGSLFTGNAYSFSVEFIFSEIKSISGCLLKTGEYPVYMTIYSKDVPTIQSNLINRPMEEDVYVSVPNALLKAYKSSTNWAQYDISSIY